MKYSNETNNLLTLMYPDKGINKTLFSNDALQNLFQDGYLINSNNFHDKTVYLSDTGKAYIEQFIAGLPLPFKQRVLRWLKSNILELVAITISIIALLKP